MELYFTIIKWDAMLNNQVEGWPLTLADASQPSRISSMQLHLYK